MKRKTLAILLMVFGCGFLPAAVFAHHGASRWDVDAWGTITETVKEFDWQNPHPLLLLDVKNDKVYPYQPYPMNFPVEAIPLPDVANAK